MPIDHMQWMILTFLMLGKCLRLKKELKGIKENEEVKLNPGSSYIGLPMPLNSSLQPLPRGWQMSFLVERTGNFNMRMFRNTSASS